MRKNLTADRCRRLFQQKAIFCGKRGEGDYTDVWMMKITIKTNQIDTGVCFFPKQITYKNLAFPLSPAFPISSLVCEFNPHAQTNMVPKIYRDLTALDILLFDFSKKIRILRLNPLQRWLFSQKLAKHYIKLSIT